jgi:hypothetical protein
MPDSQTNPDILVLQCLLYLNAFIKRHHSFYPIGLRRYGAAPSLLERVVFRHVSVLHPVPNASLIVNQAGGWTKGSA